MPTPAVRSARFALLAGFVFLAGSGPGLPSPSPAAASGDPWAILARAKEASGGDAWDALRTSHTVAEVRTSGLSGTVETWEDLLGGRGLQRYRLGPVSGAEGYDGETFWSQDASGQAQKNDGGDELLRATNDAYRRCLGFWYPQRWPAEAVDEGEREEGGRRFQVVTVTPRGGRPFAIWIDAENGLIDRMVEKAATEVRTTFFSDYREIGGVRVAYAVRGTNGETQYDQEVAVTGVEWNVETAPELFRMPGPPPPDYRFQAGASATRIPFELINNHIYLDVRLDGRGPYRFLCDTGGMNIVTPTLAGELGLASEGAVQGRGVGEASEDVGFTTLDSLGVGEVTLEKQVFAVFPLEPFAEVEGVPQSGIIGYEVFKRFVVDIDYEHRVLTLTDPKAFTYAGSGIVVPFRFDGHTPMVEGSIDGIPGAFSIDTGSRVSLTLLAPFVEKHGLRSGKGKRIAAVTGWGVGGPARGEVTRMGSLRLGGVEIRDVIADLSLQTKGAFTDPYVAGNVGAGVLRRFHLIFDYGKQTIVFEPNSAPAEPEVYDRSGMWLNAKGEAFEVMDVTAGGPAEAAGLRAGDRVAAVDGRPAGDVGLVEIRRRFRSEPPGTEIRLLIHRGDATREVVLRLADLV